MTNWGLIICYVEIVFLRPMELTSRALIINYPILQWHAGGEGRPALSATSEKKKKNGRVGQLFTVSGVAYLANV